MTLIRAFALIASMRLDARFVVVGDGPMRGEVERAVAERGLGDRIIFTGPRHDVDRLLAAFDVFVSSSRWEGLPRVVLEAMAARVPVVATDVGGIQDVIDDPATGRLVAAEDAEALAGAVVALVSDQSVAVELANVAASRLDEFDEGVMGRRLVALYDRLAHEAGLAGG
jgi:glycosyltransferase involved in cell wall biosynthesis